MLEIRKRVLLKSPVREIRTPGSVRGVPGNRCFYRDKLKDVCSQETLLSLLPFVESPKIEMEKYNTERVKQESQSSEVDSTIQNQVVV